MANLCTYDLYATGSEESLERFGEMMRQDMKPGIICSMYYSEMYSDPMEEIDKGIFKQHFSSATRWSVEGAMINNESDEDVTLTTACKMLGLSIEIWSEEPGCCFAEHIAIDEEGEYAVECADYYEIYEDSICENCQEPTVEDFIDHLSNLGISEKNLDVDKAYEKLIEESMIAIGGFAERHEFPLN